MDTDTSPPVQTRKNPWDILGIEKGAPWEDVRAAFLKKARRLHPDKGGDRVQFQELRSAYESLREVMHETPDEETSQEVWEEIEKWMDWAGRWGKRFFGNQRVQTNADLEEILRLRVPWKLLEDRTQSIKVEYDGWPVRVSLEGTETIGAVGLRVRLVPQAEYKITDDDTVYSIKEDPWRKDVSWLFDVPNNVSDFRIRGGEWSTTPGEYGCGVYWRKISV